MKIRVVCVDDSNKPKEIPKEKWVIKGKNYNITWVYKMVNQKGIQGVSLSEIDISNYKPYNCFRLNRFAIAKEDFDNLIELIKHCTELSDVDINKLVEDLQLVEKN